MNKEEIKLIKDIIIVQAGKGRIFVIMVTIDQITKLEEKLNDGNIYEQRKNDLTPKIKEEIIKKVTKLLNQDKITLNMRYYLTSYQNYTKLMPQ